MTLSIRPLLLAGLLIGLGAIQLAAETEQDKWACNLPYAGIRPNNEDAEDVSSYTDAKLISDDYGKCQWRMGVVQQNITKDSPDLQALKDAVDAAQKSYQEALEKAAADHPEASWLKKRMEALTKRNQELAAQAKP
jgi:hypothetical protein